MVGEASQMDSRENALHGWATIAEQTVVVLQATAVEHIASYADVSDGEHTEAMLAGFAAEAQLVDERLRRTRNALVHGNPVTIEMVASIRELSRPHTEDPRVLPCAASSYAP